MRKQFSGIENINTNIAINKYNPGSLEIIPNGNSILLHSVDMLKGLLLHSNLVVLFVELLAAILEIILMSNLGTNNHIYGMVFGFVPFSTQSPLLLEH